ncbi:MAG: DEAD/DEAH box helicase [Candidatus Bathyarchaeia archaeon]
MPSRSLGRSVFDELSPAVREALAEKGLLSPTAPQRAAIPHILAGRNVLLIAPTGTGKTEAALLPVLDMFLRDRAVRGISILYVTPLRALNRDMVGRLSSWAARLGFTVEVRHGDTPLKERQRQARSPPDLLVTTPETLQAILPARRMRAHLACVRWVIVDEVHELAQDKRGVQLTVGLERLREVAKNEFQRIGLSATVGNPEEVARFLVGVGRDVTVVEAEATKRFEFTVEYPFPGEADYELAQTLYTSPEAAARISRLKELIESHTSTLVFVNARTVAEMLGSRLLMLEPSVAVHHGSLSRDERSRVENSFRTGAVKALVCTSTLELGVDIGLVDLSVQYMSPRQVSTLIQRVGRSGHSMERTSRGIIIATSTDDILESIAAVRRAEKRQLEPTQIHVKALDVLAHQLAGLVMDLGETSLDEASAIIRRAYPYQDLERERLESTASFLDQLHVLRLKGGRLARTGRTRDYYYTNLSMIPDEKRYPIIDVSTGSMVGTLGDEFIQTKARVGLTFIVKGRVWRIEAMPQDDRVYVTPIEDPTAAIPGWDGEMLPIPWELAEDVGRLRGLFAEALQKGSLENVVNSFSRDRVAERYAVRKVAEELQEQIASGAPVPTDRLLVLEAFRNYLIVHAALGERANRALGYIFDYLLSTHAFIRGWWTDAYRILIETPEDIDEARLKELHSVLFSVTPELAEEIAQLQLVRSFPLDYYMKFIASRFGAIPRGLFIGEGSPYQGMTPRFSETPIYRETVREVLQEKLDVEHVKQLFRSVKTGEVKTCTFLALERPSPLAYHVLNKFIEVPELIAPESMLKDGAAHMKTALSREQVRFFCMNCWSWEDTVRIKDMAEKPTCATCGSGLLAVLNKLGLGVHDALRKKRERASLTEEELRLVARARRTADLVLSYGRRATEALAVQGIGPQTASQILAKMHDREEDFYKDLIQARLKYLTTREYWDN